METFLYSYLLLSNFSVKVADQILPTRITSEAIVGDQFWKVKFPYTVFQVGILGGIGLNFKAMCILHILYWFIQIRCIRFKTQWLFFAYKGPNNSRPAGSREKDSKNRFSGQLSNSYSWQTFGLVLLNGNFDFNSFIWATKRLKNVLAKPNGCWSSASSEGCLSHGPLFQFHLPEVPRLHVNSPKKKHKW